MKVALLGATGFVGSAVLQEALDWGDSVTAIVRDPEMDDPALPDWVRPGSLATMDALEQLRKEFTLSGRRKP
jgi:uncharacterized protein YbjT (DUF2867 family)